MAQTYLFDVVLIDEIQFARKKSNTFYFLSKARVLPFSVLFVAVNQTINKESYLAIWNPKRFSKSLI